ncbi:MAG: tetratricopeptide repeat protein [Candidatus Peribacteraceae bacterium]|nr:tetratricopeptide repeat protein [Candidatus Peribacteraceae bacterium]
MPTPPERSSGQKFVDSLVGGAPYNIFTSDQGLALKHLAGIHKALDRHQETTERALHSSSRAMVPAPQIQRIPEYLPAPEVIFDTSELAEAQREVADRLDDVIDTQRSMVQIAGAHTPLLQQGNMLQYRGNEIAAASAIVAFKQRNTQIEHLSKLAVNSGKLIERVDGMSMTISHEASATRQLLQSLLTDIGSRVTEMTNEQIITRMAVLQAIYRVRSTFLQTHAEVMLAHQQQQGLLQQLLEAQRMTERQKESRYQWQRAEVARARATSLQDLDRTLAILQEAQKQDDINPLVYVSTGTVQSSLGNTQLASVAFSEADYLLQQYPQLSSYTLMNLAENLRQMGRHAHAERVMRRATKLDPNNLEVWFLYAKVAFSAGKRAEATACLKVLIQKNPAYYRAHVATDNELCVLLPHLS